MNNFKLFNGWLILIASINLIHVYSYDYKLQYVTNDTCSSKSLNINQHFNELDSLVNNTVAGNCYVMKKFGNLSENEAFSFGCAPSFVIVGAMKSGTGALLKGLNYHPFLQSGGGPNGEKEIHFFGKRFDQSKHPLSDYLHSFLIKYNRFTLPECMRTFDKSPDYMRSRKKLAQLNELILNVRIVVILRNPSTRAISEFNHHCRHRRYRRLRQTTSFSCCGKTKEKSDEVEWTNRSVERNNSQTIQKRLIVNVKYFNSTFNQIAVERRDGCHTKSKTLLETNSFKCSGQNFADYYFSEDLKRLSILANVSKIIPKSFGRQTDWIDSYLRRILSETSQREASHGYYFDQTKSLFEM